MEEYGTIVRSMSGIYEVFAQGERISCRARGRLRLDKEAPLVGDRVRFTRQGRDGTILALEPRRNSFLRPAVANVDQLVIFAAGVIPVTDPFLIDRVAAIAVSQEVAVVLVVNKTDLDQAAELRRIYAHAGFTVIPTSAVTGEGVELLRKALAGKISVFTGNSGVGKSSILNCLEPSLGLRVAEVSQKLGRGRHTTRHVELYPLPEGGWAADTPGFASFDTERMELVHKEDLQYLFPDFAPWLGRCRFHDCAHLSEPDCALRKALEQGEVEQTRYDSYARLYQHAGLLKSWELDKDE